MMEDEDDVVETKPSILSLLNRLYEQPSMDTPNQSDDRRDSESPDEQVKKRLGTLPSDIRNTLEERFIELVQRYPCFYDPNDKNFVHNQHKSNTYQLIAKKLSSEGLETTGTQLATLFKSMKAKYRDESRRLARSPELEPSPFFKKLHFLETGLNSVDQRLAKFRATNGHHHHQKSIGTRDANERYVHVIANALDKFSPEMKESFLNFITALNDLNEPVKHLENFTRVAKELKRQPNATVEVTKPTSSTNGSTAERYKPVEQSQKISNPQIGDLVSDLESMGQTFKGQKDLLALFRVLGNVVTKLPTRRRHSHLQGLLNISSAALHSPVQISWQSEIFKPVEKAWSTVDNTITIDGPSPNESNNELNSHLNDDSVEIIPIESKRDLKRKHHVDEDEDASDNESVMSIVTDESFNTKTSTNGRSESNGRFPRAAKNTSRQMSPIRKTKRR